LVTIIRNDDILKRLRPSKPKRRLAETGEQTVGVYDILPTNCMRKAYYTDKTETASPSEPATPALRGRAVEAAISWLLFGNSRTSMERHSRHEKAGIVCYTDLSDSETIMEVKDTSTGRRLIPEDIQFKGYLMQVLYYMVITEKEEAILAINYSSKELIWHHNDCNGRSWFYRPANAKSAGLECWDISMLKDDHARVLLWEQMLRRKNVFLKALETNDVSILPRVRMHDRKLKCSGCPYYERCMHRDGETEDARMMANDLDLLDMRGFLIADCSDNTYGSDFEQ
jgi:hypothetical protein